MEPNAVLAPEADVVHPLACLYRDRIVTRARQRRQELVDRVTGAIFAELPDYGTGRSPRDIADIRSGVQRSVGLCLAAIAEGRGPNDDELGAMRVTAGQRARQGIPKAVVLASVKIGTRVGRTFLMTCGDPTDDPDGLLAAFRQITGVLDRFEDEACRAMGEGYDEAYTQVLSTGDRGEALLVDRLLECRFRDEAEILRHASEVGLMPSRDAYLLVLAPLRPAEGSLHEATAALRERGQVAVGPVRSTHGVHLPVLAQPGARHWDELLTVLDKLGRETSTVVVWHERPVRLTALWEVYRHLQPGLPFLQAATARPGALPGVILRFHRAMFAGSAQDKLALVKEVLLPLVDPSSREGAELLTTLDCYYETGGSSAVLARQLFVHKNTITNRLRRVRQLTGLDIREPRERLVLETLLRMRWLADRLSEDTGPTEVAATWAAAESS